MIYMGGKGRIAKDILSIILNGRTPGQAYVEPFVGGCNSLDKVPQEDGPRIAGDMNPYLISLWRVAQRGSLPNRTYTKEEYHCAKKNRDKNPALTGWLGFGCSFRGKWFGGYAGKVNTKAGNKRDYQAEARRNIARQVPKIQGVTFHHAGYRELGEFIPANSIIYCDPPYENTTSYSGAPVFDHADFWAWCREMTLAGHKVFISEYNAPGDFQVVWESLLSSSLSATAGGGGSKQSIEKLFTMIAK